MDTVQHSFELLEIFEGINEECNLRVPSEPPTWLDKDAFFRGQQYFRDNALSVLAGSFRNLIVGLFIQNLCDPLVLTRRSETAQKAEKRYYDTVVFLNRWYQMVPWEDDTNLQMVAKYHMLAASLLKNTTLASRNRDAREIIEKLPKEEIQVEPTDDLLMHNIQEYKQSAATELYHRYRNSDLIFSQFNMSLVHSAFFQAVVLFPHLYGAKQNNLDGFVHFWRVIGYYLGIKDKFNLARSSLDETRRLLLEVILAVGIPCITEVSQVSLHMAKCVSKAFNANLNIVMYTTLKAYGYELEKVWKSFTWKQRLIFFIRYLIISWLYYIPYIRDLFNWIIFYRLDVISKNRKKFV